MPRGHRSVGRRQEGQAVSWMFVCFLISSRDHRNYICASILHRWFFEATSGTEKHEKQSPKLYRKKKASTGVVIYRQTEG